MQIDKNPHCPACGRNPTIRAMPARDNFYCFAGSSDRPVRTISAEKAHERHAADPQSVVFLDVRELPEWKICRIAGAKHIPLNELEGRMNELDAARDLVVYCLTGARSRKALNTLADAGFGRLWHLKGGLRAWAEAVDPDMWIY
jgi:sulfur-carrier protein adenylyltransferase/sulfurtransferase